MSRTLPLAREAFVAAITQDTPGTDLPRFVAVLDALIAWSVARPELLAFRPSAAGKSVVSFSRVGAKGAFWSAQVTRGVGPRLEIHLPSADALDDAQRATVMRTLNANSRAVLVEGDRLRIGFGALKNATAQAAVLALMDQLLVDGDVPAVSSSAEPAAARSSTEHRLALEDEDRVEDARAELGAVAPEDPTRAEREAEYGDRRGGATDDA